ncbi:hypothetical protein FRC00_009286 [Tulasnella sp. 408]|nr:hypothetical protein FRC00_009286 [Tulasnella sp. 408]
MSGSCVVTSTSATRRAVNLDEARVAGKSEMSIGRIMMLEEAVGAQCKRLSRREGQQKKREGKNAKVSMRMPKKDPELWLVEEEIGSRNEFDDRSYAAADPSAQLKRRRDDEDDEDEADRAVVRARAD